MLAGRYPEPLLRDLLTPADAYHPFPTIEERSAWEELPVVLRDDVIQRGERYLGYEWPFLPATRYMDFARDGNRSRYQALYFPRRLALGSLVNAECVEGEGRFLDEIINGIWAICEESSWVVPAHNYGERGHLPLPDSEEPIIDLFAAETGSLLSWTQYLLKSRLDAVTPLVTERISREIQARIITPFLERYFWWMGLTHDRAVNNWNPWCTTNCLATLLLVEEDADRRIAGVAKGMRCLDRFLAGYHPDGGCDEGPGYWTQAGGALFDALEQLYWASDGRISVYDQPLIGAIGRYPVSMHISEDYFVNFADGSAKVQLPWDLMHRYGRRVKDQSMQAMGVSAYRASAKPMQIGGYHSFTRVLPALFNWPALDSADFDTPFLRDSWMDGIQVMTAREQVGSESGLYLAAKGGHNNESHNHNDVGHFIIYLDGEPLVIDVGVDEYTAITFSPQRYDIWTMQSAYHNLPTVNGVQQQAGREYAASNVSYHADDSQAVLVLDIAPAYSPEAGINAWQRTCRLTRGKVPAVEVEDACSLAQATDDIVWTFMTVAKPQILDNETIALATSRGAEVKLSWSGPGLAPETERIAIEGTKLAAVWGDTVYRLLLRLSRPITDGQWRFRFSR